MKKYFILTIVLLACMPVFAQQPIKYARQKSWQYFIYRIPADTAEKYINKYVTYPDRYLAEQPFRTIHADTINYESLPVGNYLIISALGSNLRNEVYCRSNLQVSAINNQKRVQLEVRTREGFYPAAQVWVNKKRIDYNSSTRSYWVHDKNPDEALVKVIIPGDTLFVEIWSMEDEEKGGWSQWWTNFRYSRVGNIISWPVRSIGNLFTPSWNRRGTSKRGKRATGYMVFNKPRYKPQDTVKFKAYILDAKEKQYKKPLDIYLEWYSGKYYSRQIGTVKPETPGAFIHEFVLGDSLVSDTRYTISFKDKKNKKVFGGNFSIEDYLLDEVASYSIRTEKERYFRNDTMVFYAKASDANGLPVMDGKVSLYVLAQTINQFYTNRIHIPDTLWKAEKPLAVSGDTKFEVPAGAFPAADMSLTIKAEFLNSNNELQEKQKSVNFFYHDRLFDVDEKDGYIKAELIENGKSVAKAGWMKRLPLEKEIPVVFPYSEKTDAHTEEYIFFIKNDSGKITLKGTCQPDDYNLGFADTQQQDTAGFVLYNPYKIPVYYTVFRGNKIVATGADSTDQISWKEKLSAKNIYTIEWQYIWAGTEKHGSNQLAVLDKVMQSTISGTSTVYPGLVDTITIAVKDYKGRAARDVNLTAVSYNMQFGSSVNVPEPPHLKKYKSRRRIMRDSYEIEESGIIKKPLLGNHQQWIQRLGLDSMLYYQHLFPKDGYHVARSIVGDFIPQVAVHAAKNGVAQKVYLLYINRELVYNSMMTEQGRYAFSALPGYAQILFRLQDKLIQVDSVYLQPFYKHDINFDIDHLPARAVIKSMPDYYTAEEMSLIERTTWKMEAEYNYAGGYIWQGSKVVPLSSRYSNTAGPFIPNDSLHYYKPGDFDIRFLFETGYSYKLSPKMVRLERSTVFYGKGKVKLHRESGINWILGDTIVPPPVMGYSKPAMPALRANYNPFMSAGNGFGKLLIQTPKDSLFRYVVLHKSNEAFVQTYPYTIYAGLEPGVYELILVTSHANYLTVGNLVVKAGETYCVWAESFQFSTDNEFIKNLVAGYDARPADIVKPKEVVLDAKPVPSGQSTITGRVVDRKGKAPIPFASIFIKGSSSGVVSKENGTFSINAIREGTYTLVVSYLGYTTKEIRIRADKLSSTGDIELEISTAALSEVVVMGYGVSHRKSNTVAYSLSGRLAGLNAPAFGVYDPDYKRDSAVIRIRGMSSVATDKPLYVINGVAMEELPLHFNMRTAKVNILKDEAATSIYGARASNGAIIITTDDFMPKALREEFRDYAFWKPNLFTDEDGNVSFTVTYPDNITGWQTYVLGMDKKKRITKTRKLVKSFKPLLAQLSAPQFMIEGDSVAFIGKTTNYSADAFSVKNEFAVNGNKREPVGKQLAANAAVIEELLVVPASPDTLSAQYTVTTTAGYSDGEKRKIPVMRKGIEETIGNFWILEKDTAVSFMPDKNAGTITIHAQNNTLDVLLEEIKHLKEYPYYCMEQSASKLVGFVMEKKIREALKQPFKYEKELRRLISDLQKGQLFEGSWGWWQGGKANIAITNYVTQALLLVKEYPLVETNIRNALLYLHNRLAGTTKYEMLSILFVLSEANHMMDYASYLNRLPFDSLNIHAQWQVVRIKQRQALEHSRELKKVMEKRIGTMLGGSHWGEESYWWERNMMATTVLAFTTLENEKGYQDELKRIIQFFLERRKKGHWMNTVESASIVSAILSSVLRNQTNFTTPATLQINNTIVREKEFPYTTTIAPSAASVTISKSGGGLLYCTAYQEIFNKDPLPVTDKFRINTWFERSGNSIASLKAGEKVTMKIELEVTADADYVQIEIPIPAGCTYGNKKQDEWNMHKEFLKNKAVFFAEKLAKGKYNYELELEPRYTGTYTLNPAKAELMYFPVFFGRNESKSISIKK